MNDSFLDLQNKTALITGASGGIGAASALLLAQCGVFCWLNYNTNEDKALKLLESIRKKGGDGRLIKADLTDQHDISKLLKQLVADTSLDILVNNSGITRDSLLTEMKDQDFHEVIDINLQAPFKLIRELGKVMMKNNSGKIINISSVSSFRGSVGQANYSASKAGLEALTRIAAIELGPFGINVNSVAPGITNSNMTAHLMHKYDKKLKRSIPLRRFAEPSDIASVVLFLASPMSDYITGQTIITDGGYNLAIK